MSTLTTQWHQRTRRLCLLAAVAGMLTVSAAAQDRTGRDVYDEQLRVRLDEQVPAAREVGVEAGGWFTFSIFNYDDAGEGKRRTLRQHQLRGWVSLNYRDVHRVYVRGLLTYDDWNSDENPIARRGDDFTEQVERAWYQFDLSRCIVARGGQAPPVDVKLKVGRQFMTIGTALALSMPLDAVRLDVGAGDWQCMAFLGKSIRFSRNIDHSDRVARRQDRCLFGVEIAYAGFDHHRPFVFFLYNQDNTEPKGRDFFQSYDYSSHYVGLGSEGTLVLPNLRYQTELVGEWGKTFSDGVTAGRDRICAVAFDARLGYLLDHPTHPRFTLEYLFATGDEDRSTSSTNTVGGNRAGTKDTAFNAFGFRDTGIAFSPRISNLHMYALGASFFPLEHMKWFRKMEVGSKVFFYHKASNPGPVSDTTATNDARFLGWEWDLYCNWRITSDLAWTIRYGAFQPGSAFDRSEDSCRQFLYSGIVLSF